MIVSVSMFKKTRQTLETRKKNEKYILENKILCDVTEISKLAVIARILL